MVRLVASDHPIKSVTIFKSRKAEVVRVFQLDFKKGQNKIEITGLSSVIDNHSVRVSGLKPTCRLFDVVCRIGKPTGYDDGTIRQLKAQKAQLIQDKDTREKGRHLLLQYADTLTGEHVRPEQMSQFVESLVEQNKKAQTAIAAIDEQLVNLNLKISKLEDEDSSRRGTTHGKVDIVVVADEDCTSELKLTYIVSNVEWYPTYELHAKTENGKPSPSVSLHYRARITQSTGESWDNTSLTLSTVSSDGVLDGMIPELKVLKIQPVALFGSKARSHQNNNNTGFSLFGRPPNQPFAQQQAPQQQQQAQQQQQQQQAVQQYQQQQAVQHYQQQQQQQQPQLYQQQAIGSQQPQSTTSLFGSTAPTPFGSSSAFGTSSTSAFGQFSQGGFGNLFGTSNQFESHDVGDGLLAVAEDDSFEEVEGPAAPTITEPKTIVSETPIAIAYSVHGESTIPSDGIQHQVSIAVLPFQATISYITIPRMNPRLFLQCLVVNSSEYRLLAGIVSVIMDESYVSKTSIQDINMGDTFECTLGDDASAKVTYSRASRRLNSTGGSFIEDTTTTSYTTTITVHNKHNFPITDLIVRDIIPTCDDKRVKIVLRKPIGLADAKSGQTINVAGTDGLKVGWDKMIDGKGGEKEGRYEWKWKVESGARVSFVSEWEIKTPGDTAWAEVFNPADVRFGQKA